MEEELLKMSVNARCVGCKEPTKFVAGFYDGPRGKHGCFYDCENEACAVNQILRCAESKEAQKMMQIQEDNGRLGMYAGEIAALRKDVGLTIMQMSQMAGCSPEVKAGLLKPYVGAYTQLDFSLPCPSIFDSTEEIKEKYGIRAVRPLAKKTMDRIARGIKKFILDNPEPFLIQCNHGGERKPGDIRQPMPTITGKHGFGVVEPKLAPIIDKAYGGNYSGAGSRVNDPIDTITTVDHNRLVEATLAPCIMCNNENNVGKDIRSPLPTITTGNRNFVAAPILIQYHSETMQNETRGQGMKDPLMTVDGSNRYGLVTSFISKFYKSGTGQDIREPLHTVTTSPGHFGEVRAFLTKYYGAGTGQDIKAPLDTITAQDRFGLVTIYGTEYQIVDIGLRMLEPKELYGCQGFPDDYIIDRDCDGKPYPRAEQVRRCGNAVCPPIPTALVRANLKELCVAKRLPNCRADRLGEDAGGQLRFA